MSDIVIQKSHGFTAISNYHLNDKRLSFQAKGMLTVLLAYPIGTHISVNLLIENSTNQKASVYSILKELEKVGYVEKFQEKKSGNFGRVKYVVYEIPQGKKEINKPEPPMKSALTDFREAENEKIEDLKTSETRIKTPLTDFQEADQTRIKSALTENRKAYTNNIYYSLFEKIEDNLELPNFNEEIFERNKKCLKSDAVHMNVNSYLKIENLNLKNSYDSYVDRFMIKVKATGEYNFHINKLQPYFINWLKIEAKTEVMPKVFSKSYNDWKGNQESSKPRNYIN